MNIDPNPPRPWGPIDPNSQHQLWSHWEFRVFEMGRHVPMRDVQYNAAKYMAAGFGTVGQLRVTETAKGYTIELFVEGAPAHDPGYVESVRSNFYNKFVKPGWSEFTLSSVKARVVAGDQQDGKAAGQLVVMPSIRAGA